MRSNALRQTRSYTSGIGYTVLLLIITVALLLVSCSGIAGAESVRPPIVVPSVSGPVVAPPGPTGVVHSDGTSVLSETPVNMSEINLESLGYVSSTVTVVSGPPAFLSGWSYRKIHAIGGSPDGDLTNYQMRFVVWRTTGTDSGENVYVGTNVREDYGDLRFTTVAGAQIPYWIESVNATAAVVWVKVPSIPRAGTQIVMYYGNRSAVSESSGSAVFNVFEDFEESVLNGWTLDSGVTVSQVTEGSNKVGRFTSNGVAGSGAYKSWTAGSGIIEYSIKPAQTTAYHTVSAFSGHASGVKGAWFFAANIGKFGSATPSWAYFTSYVANQWYTVRLDLKGNGYYDAYVNGVKIGADWAYYGATTTDRLGLVGWTTGGQAYYDNIRVRKFTNTRPVHGGWLSGVTTEQLAADFSFTPTSGQYPLNVTFTDLSTGPITSRSWDFGDSGSSTEQNPSHTFTGANTYSVTLTVSSTYGQSPSSITKTIVVSAPPSFPADWQNQKIFIVSSGTGSTVTNTPFKLTLYRTSGTDSGNTVYLGSSVRSDFGDIRFTDSGGSQIPYWIESVSDGVAVVWIKPSSISSTGTQFSIYYNCAGATSQSDGSSIFSVFEDFEESVLSSWTLDSGVTMSQVTEGSNKVGRFTSNGVAGSGAYKSWTAGSGIIEYSIKPAQTTAYHTVSAFSGHASGIKGAWFYAANNGKFGSATPSWAYFTSYTANQWYTVRLDLKGNGYYDAYVNGVKIGTDWAYYGTTTTDRLGLVGWTTGGQAFYDNIRVRPYVSTEPGIEWIDPSTPLMADFSFTPTSGQYPLNVTFTDLSTGPITSRSWDFGDSGSSTEQNPSHTFTGANTYSVTLTVSSTYGQSPSSITKTIVVSAPPSFPADWQNQKIFIVSSGTGSTVTNTPFKLTLYRTSGTDSGNTVYLGSSVRSDFGDIRFTDSGGSQIPYWIESVSDGVAVVWIKPSSISSTGTQFSIYYNCAGATSQSDGSSIFSVFEDFEESVLSSWTLDSGVTMSQVTEGSNKVGRFTSNGVAGSGAYKSWTAGSGIIEYSIKPAQTTAYHTVSAFSGHASGIKGAWFYAANNGKFGSATPSWAYFTSYTANQWYTVRLDLKGNGYYDAYVNGVKIGTDWAYYGTTTTDRLGLVGWTTGGQAFYDNIRVRPYVAAEPGIEWIS